MARFSCVIEPETMAACVCIIFIIFILIDACVCAVIASGDDCPAVNVAFIFKTVRVSYGKDSASREEADFKALR